MIVSLLVVALCVVAVVVGLLAAPGVYGRRERLAGWDDRLAGPDLVRFPATRAAGASVGDTPRRPGASAPGVEVRTPTS